jgi:hypothetical protein
MRDTLFLSDLDNCLFQSHRVNPKGVVPMTFKATGEPHCFATVAQQILFDTLKPRALCVAITARTPDQMSRTRGWNPEHRHQLALTDHGATMLYRDIESQAGWTEISAWALAYRSQAVEAAVHLEHDEDRLRVALRDLIVPEHTSAKLSMSHSFEAKVPFYLTLQIKGLTSAETEQVMASVRQQLAPLLDRLQGTYIQHQNDYTLAFWPTYVNKRKAAERLIGLLKSPIDDPVMQDERFAHAIAEMGPTIGLVLTAGDSHSDIPFMMLGDFMLTPVASPIATKALEHAEQHMSL